MISKAGGVRLPNFLLPACFLNHGNYIVSLGMVCRWLAAQETAIGVEIFPEFAAAAQGGEGPMYQSM